MSAIKLKRTTIYSDVAKDSSYNEQLKKHMPLAHVRTTIDLHPFIIPFDVFVNKDESYPWTFCTGTSISSNPIPATYTTANASTTVSFGNSYTSSSISSGSVFTIYPGTMNTGSGIGPIYNGSVNIPDPPLVNTKPVLPYPDWDNLTEEDIKKYSWIGEYLLHKPTGRILHIKQDTLDNILDFVFENILILCSKELILDQDEWNMLKWGKTKQPSKITYNIQCVGEFSLIEETDEKVRILIKL